MIYDYSNIEDVFVIGDIHGEFESFFYKIKQRLTYDTESFKDEVDPIEIELNKIAKNNEDADATTDMYEETLFQRFRRNLSKKHKNLLSFNNSIIFVCGDCGFGFNKFGYYTNLLEKQNALLQTTNTHIIFVRGNHDDPKYFHDKLIDYSNIKCVDDYSLIKTKNNNILCVGGAVSVDRIWRKQEEARLNKYSQKRKLYWEGEEPYFNGNVIDDLAREGVNIDIVITHTAPKFCPPKDKLKNLKWFTIDKNLDKDLKNERSVMTELYQHIIKTHKIRNWFYGHFHESNIHTAKPKEYNKDEIYFVGLSDNMEIQDIKLYYKINRKPQIDASDLINIINGER